MGFLRVPLGNAIRAMVTWGDALHQNVTIDEGSDGLEAGLRALAPLTIGVRPRQLLITASARWTAYFDCLHLGTDPIAPMGYLARSIPCESLAISDIPDTQHRTNAAGRYGSVQFQMFGPADTDFLNYVRTVGAVNEGGHWVFVAAGEEQPFEEPEAYAAPRVRDRFTSAMLERYCQALGIDVFNAEAYGPKYAIIADSGVVVPVDMEMTLEDAQRRLGIVPGAADHIPG
jgi:hypothetical protein